MKSYSHRPAARAAVAAVCAAAAWLAGCTGTPTRTAPPAAKTAAAWPAAPDTGATPAANGPATARTPLAREGIYTWTPQMGAASQQLQTALQGRGADISQTTDQRLWLSLPVEGVFAKGRSALEPAGRGSLDQLVLALRGNPRVQLQILGDADPGASGGALALDRAASARDWMVARGVPVTRIAIASRPAKPGAADPRRLDILVGERATTVAR